MNHINLMIIALCVLVLPQINFCAEKPSLQGAASMARAALHDKAQRAFAATKRCLTMFQPMWNGLKNKLQQ